MNLTFRDRCTACPLPAQPADTRGRQELLGRRSIVERLRVCLGHLHVMTEALAAKRSVLRVVGEIEQKAKGPLGQN